MDMKITTTMIEDEFYQSRNANGNIAPVDMRKGDAKKSLSPTELVLSALAGCGAVDIVSMLRKRKKSVTSFTIETVGTRRDEAPRSFTRIHCQYILTSPDVTEEELQKAAALTLEKYCSVASSLKAEITFSVNVIRG